MLEYSIGFLLGRVPKVSSNLVSLVSVVFISFSSGSERQGRQQRQGFRYSGNRYSHTLLWILFPDRVDQFCFPGILHSNHFPPLPLRPPPFPFLEVVL